MAKNNAVPKYIKKSNISRPHFRNCGRESLPGDFSRPQFNNCGRDRYPLSRPQLLHCGREKPPGRLSRPQLRKYGRERLLFFFIYLATALFSHLHSCRSIYKPLSIQHHKSYKTAQYKILAQLQKRIP